VGPFGFYGKCLGHASGQTWFWLGTFSTLATYIPAVAVKLFGVVHLDMDALALYALPIAIMLCFILVPFREAFKLYKESETAWQNKLQESQEHWQSRCAKLEDDLKQAKAPVTSPHLVAREAEYRRQIEALGTNGRRVLRRIIECGAMDEPALVIYCSEECDMGLEPYMDCTKLPFVTRDFVTGRYSVQSDAQSIVYRILSESATQP
jgi:hypothetical protein